MGQVFEHSDESDEVGQEGVLWERMRRTTGILWRTSCLNTGTSDMNKVTPAPAAAPQTARTKKIHSTFTQTIDKVR